MALLWLTLSYRDAERGMFRVRPGQGIAMAPDRPRPGRIALPAADHMDMELRHHIAQVADIQLFHAGQRADQLRQARDLGDQQPLIFHPQVAHLDGAGTARHQQAPLIAAVIVEKDPAERPIGQGVGQGLDDRIDDEITHANLLGSKSGMTPALPSMSAAISSAMAGVKRMPLRYWPLATNRPSANGPSNGRPSGLLGRRPAQWSARSQAFRPGIKASAAPRSLARPCSVKLVSKPASSAVAPTKSRPWRGTQ